jgi:signal transduction histidine kinase
LKQLTAGLLTAREEERTAIAREIHDVLGQSLTALKMDVAWIGSRAPDAPPPFAKKLAAMPGLIDDMVVTVRRIASDLRPGVLDDFGLAAAIEWQAQEFEQRTGVSCVLRTAIDDGALDPLLATALFRIFQESLTNVTRHSRASRVSVTLEHRGTDLVLEVRDDGVGIESVDAASTRSIGLTGMRERAQLVGGSLSVTGAPGAGTTVRAQVPHRVAIIQSAAGVVPGPAGAA